MILEAIKLADIKRIYAYRANDRRNASIKQIALLLLFLLTALVLIDTIHFVVSQLRSQHQAQATGEEETTWLFSYLLATKSEDVTDSRPVIVAAIFGALGACLSALFAMTLQKRTPPEWEREFRSWARPLIGAMSGLVALVVVYSGLFGNPQPAGLALLAFVFGFSERLVIGTVQQLEVEGQGAALRRKSDPNPDEN